MHTYYGAIDAKVSNEKCHEKQANKKVYGFKAKF